MKKRKTYEVSVINKTYSKTYSDETKFYTSDTALELGFKLKETEYDFESAEIVLLNINDKSLITRRVVKSDEGFVYTFEKDVIAHYGEWKAQLMFIENVDAHVASPIKFRIENDLYSTKPQALSDVVSWVNLKLYAEKLVGEFKQAVDEAFAKNVEIENTFKTNEQNRQTAFETAEQSRQTTFETNESEREKGESVRAETFQTNETERQTTFETAEQSRQATFETNESVRTETFNANEDVRKAQELEREKAEGTRQTTFDSNEAIRTETFNTNEATRQENESTRQQAEQERVSAESIRVENESQRNLTYDNLKNTIDMIGKVKLVNLVDNGDFSDGLKGVIPIHGTRDKLSIENSALRVDSLTNAIDLGFYFRMKTLNKSNKYYISVDLELFSDLAQIIYVRSAVPKIENLLSRKAINGKISGIASPSVNLETFYVTLNGDKGTEPYHYHIKSIQVIDLTNTFGAGNEPAKEIIDWIISENGYFEELTLRRDDIQQYEINQLRKAVIALGGTI